MIDELRQRYSLKVLLRVSGLSKSTYSYYHCEKHLNAVKRRKEEDEHILSLILPVFEHHKSRYGYRRIILALKEELADINHKRIQRIMNENHLFGKQPKNKYHSYKCDNGKKKDNLLLHKENGRPMFRSSGVRRESSIFHPSWICMTVTSSLTTSRSALISLRQKNDR